MYDYLFWDVSSYSYSFSPTKGFEIIKEIGFCTLRHHQNQFCSIIFKLYPILINPVFNYTKFGYNFFNLWSNLVDLPKFLSGSYPSTVCIKVWVRLEKKSLSQS